MALKESDLASTTDQLDLLWDRVHRTRSTSTTVTVDRGALTAILLDHTSMAAELFSRPLVIVKRE